MSEAAIMAECGACHHLYDALEHKLVCPACAILKMQTDAACTFTQHDERFLNMIGATLNGNG